MKLKFFKLFFTLIILLSFNYGYSYNYIVNDNSYTIDTSSKYKVDIFVSKKITSNSIANKYITALNKINPISLKASKQNIYYYLKYRLYIYVSPNVQVTTPALVTQNIETQKIVSQSPINTPVTLPSINIPNTNRVDTTSNLSDTKKAYIDEIRSKVKEYIEVDNNYEFLENWEYYRVKINEYYQIKWTIPANIYIKAINVENQILLRKWDNFLLTTWGYNIEKKYSIKELVNSVKFSWNWSWTDFFEVRDSNYYMYSLYNFKYYELPETWVYLSQLANIKNLSDALLIQKDWKYLLVSWFTETKLFNTSLLLNIKNPLLVLRSIWKDYYFYKSENINNIINRVKNKTNEIITNSNSNSEKITAIYSWITWNITYDAYSTRYLKWEFSEETYLSKVNKAVFSWMGTFENNSWVCDWYSKLMQYMLNFAWIDNVEIESWDADIWGGKLVPHARVKITNLYYDPTWDITTKWNSTKFKRFALTWAEIHKTHIVSQE